MTAKVRFRQTWRQVAPTAAMVAAVFAVFPAGGRDHYVIDVLTAIAIGVGGGFGLRHGGAEVDAGGITVIRLGRKRYPWASVSDVERVRQLGGEGLRLVAGGRRVPLTAPTHVPYFAPDPAFEDKAATIERFWRQATNRAT